MVKDLELSECLKILGNHFIGRLSYIHGKSPYLVPVTYFHDNEENSIIRYSAQGHKLHAMRKRESVAFQVDNIESIQEWHSVQEHGWFEELNGSRAKKYLRRFAKGVQKTITSSKSAHPKFIQNFSNRLQNKNIPVVYRIHIADIMSKVRNDQKRFRSQEASGQ